MRVQSLVLAICVSLLTGCLGGGGSANEGSSETPNTPSNTDQPTANDTTTPTDSNNNNNSGGNNSNTPNPGDIVSQSDPFPGVQYPDNSQPVVFAQDFQLEPGSDGILPIIELVNYPSSYTANNAGTIQLWAADDINGSGLKQIECSVDGSSFADCGTQLDLTNLSEGIHYLSARAEDWDGNQSTEVSYAFYVDQTPPTVNFVNSPTAISTSTDANFEFSAQDDGSGVSGYYCRTENTTLASCNSNETLQNLPEGQNTVYVQAEDNVGNRSPAQQYQWIIDNSAPVIQVNQQPGSTIYTGSNALINFTVSDVYSPNGIVLACRLNGTAIPCNNNMDISIPAPMEASFSFEIMATDIAGNSATQMINWQALLIAEDRMTNVTVEDQRPVDILFVVDNSGSMNFERSNLAQRIDGMINVINGLDWQIAVISTDSSGTGANKDGNLIEMRGLPGQYILDSNMNQATAQNIFGDTVQNFPGGSGTEEGIYSSKRVIDKYLNGEVNHTNFIRNGADLSIVVLSDEDEASNGGSNARITPQQFVNFVDSSFNGQKNMVFHSIITRPGDSTCLSGEGAAYGDEYDALSRLTGFGQPGGAIIGSVCNQDYTSQLRDIGQSVKDLRNSIQLQCAPFDSDNNGTPDVTVYYRADSGSAYQVYNGARSFNNNRVIFTDLLPPGDYRVDYQCRIN